MKTRTITILLCLASMAIGATTITYVIPNDKGLAIIEAFLAQDNAHVLIAIRGSQDPEDPNTPDYSARIDFRTPVRDPNDDNATYVKKRTALFVNAMVAAHKAKIKQDTLKEYNLLAPSVDVNEPTEDIE